MDKFLECKTAVAVCAAALLAAVVCGAGCEHTRPVFDAQNPPIELLEGGRVVYNGFTVPVEELPDRLLADGAGRRDEIPVLLREGVSRADAKPLATVMLSRGFSRIIYVTPRRGVSYVKGNGTAPAQSIAAPAASGAPSTPAVRYRRSRNSFTR